MLHIVPRLHRYLDGIILPIGTIDLAYGRPAYAVKAIAHIEKISRRECWSGGSFGRMSGVGKVREQCVLHSLEYGARLRTARRRCPLICRLSRCGLLLRRRDLCLRSIYRCRSFRLRRGRRQGRCRGLCGWRLSILSRRSGLYRRRARCCSRHRIDRSGLIRIGRQLYVLRCGRRSLRIPYIEAGGGRDEMLSISRKRIRIIRCRRTRIAECHGPIESHDGLLGSVLGSFCIEISAEYLRAHGRLEICRILYGEIRRRRIGSDRSWTARMLRRLPAAETETRIIGRTGRFGWSGFRIYVDDDEEKEAPGDETYRGSD